MDNLYIYLLLSIILLAVVFLGFRFILKNKIVKPSSKSKSGLNIPELIEFLGGKSNINDVSSNGSKVCVVVKDPKIVKIEAIKNHGATGIVQNQNKLLIIYGKLSSVIENEINTFLK